MCAAVATNNTENLGSGPSSVSRSGRVRKKSSLLADYESTDGFEKPRKKNEERKVPKSKERNSVTPKVTLELGSSSDTPKRTPGKRGPKGKRMKLDSNSQHAQKPDRDYLDDDEGELEIDLPPEYEGGMVLAAEEIIDEDMLDEEDGATEVAENTSINRLKSQAESTYFMEKSLEKSRKSLSVTPGQPGKVKQARKDKGSTRVTAYMLWSKEQRAAYEKKNANLDFPQMSKKLSDLWATVPQNQKKMWKNKAAKIMKKKSSFTENMKNTGPAPKGRPPKNPQLHLSTPGGPPPSKPTKPHPQQQPTAPKQKETKVTKGPKKITTPSKLNSKPPKPGPGPSNNSHTPLIKNNSKPNNKAPAFMNAKGPNKSPINRSFPKGKANNSNNNTSFNAAPSPSSSKGSSPGQKGRPPNSSKTKTPPFPAPNNSKHKLQNSFSLVSSEFSQQTNVHIKGDKNFSNSRHSVNSNNLSASAHSSKALNDVSHSKTNQYSPRKEDDTMFKVTGSAPIDVAAHFSLLGESLSIIGERLKEHQGQTVSGSLSVLLDSLLCACGPLLCLTQQVPELNTIPPEKLAHILDNIAYIMPGL